VDDVFICANLGVQLVGKLFGCVSYSLHDVHLFLLYKDTNE